MTIETKFNLGQSVWIKQLRVPARVTAIFIGLDGPVQYQCRWFNGYDPKSDYLLEEEISLPPEGEAVGFLSQATVANGDSGV